MEDTAGGLNFDITDDKYFKEIPTDDELDKWFEDIPRESHLGFVEKEEYTNL